MLTGTMTRSGRQTASSIKALDLGQPAMAASVALAIGGTTLPLLLIAFAGSNSSTFCEKSLLAPPRGLFVAGTGLLFGLIPAAKELLRRSLIALLHVADPGNVVGVLKPVPEGARLPPLLK